MLKLMSFDAAAPNPRPAKNLFSASILQNCLVCGVITLDAQKQITALCPEAERLTRVTAAQGRGRSADIFPAALRQFVDDIFAGDRTPADRQLELHPEAADAGLVRAHAVVMPGVSGDIASVVIVLHDLGVVYKLELNMRRLDRLANIGTLSASFAHEIKNAIVAIKTFVDLLLEKNPDAELVEIVGREMKRINAIVSQMLRVAVPAKPHFAAVSIHELLEHSVRLVQHQINEKMIIVHRSLTAVPDVVWGDAYQLEQALMNLLLNALEAMNANGELTLASEVLPAAGSAPAQLRLTVRDTGVGIPAENMSRLFETFFTTKKHGTGLGLAITRRIIEEHHGSIAVESQPQHGAAFTLLLPLHVPGQN